MEIQHMMDNLLLSVNWKEAAEQSYTNFHAEGVSYLNLLRTERLTVKLYTFNNVPHNAQGFMVHPHSHGYNFTHRTMVGMITNHKFSLVKGDDWNIYSFMTKLNGGSGLTKLPLPCGLAEVGKDFCRPRQSYYLGYTEVHTISTPDSYAAALLLQFHDVEPGSPTVMFAPVGEDPNCATGLYHRMSAHEGKTMIEQYQDRLAATGGEKDERHV